MLLPALHDVGASETIVSINAVEMIPPDRVLAWPWSEVRLSEARQRLVRCEPVDPIEVTRYRIGKQVWYSPIDGNHRAWAAREAGLTHVDAYIRGEVQCRPDQYLIMERLGVPALWCQLSTGAARLVMELEAGEVALAFELGVQDRRGKQ